MSNTDIVDFSTTADDNLNINGISIAPGWPPSDVGPAVRALCSLLARVCQGVAGWTAVLIDGAAATSRTLGFTTVGSNRWQVQANNSAESGANAGSNFTITRYDDSGTAIDTPLSINRATGVTTFADAVVFGAGVTFDVAPTFGSLTLSGALTVGGAATFDAGVSFTDWPTYTGSVATITATLECTGVFETTGDARLGTTDSNPITSAVAGATWTSSSGTFTVNTLGSSAAVNIGTQSGSNLVAFFRGSSLVGTITTSGSATSYNTTSDYRLKDVHGPADAQFIHDIRVHDAAFKAAPAARYPMLLAHELAEVAPWCVTGEKDAVDSDGRIIPQQVDYSKLVPALIALVKDQDRRLRALETVILDTADALGLRAPAAR